MADIISARFDRSEGGVEIGLIIGNSEALWADLAAAQLDAILVHHIPAGAPGWFNPVALDGLVLVTHPGNAVAGLELEQARSIFAGQVTNWAALGGLDGAIVLVGREAGAGARSLFLSRVMAERRVAITAEVQPGNAALLASVLAQPGAIGYSMMGAARSQPAASRPRMLALGGLAPTPATTADQSYPLTVPLYFVSPAEPQGELRALLAWLQSDEGQEIIGENYGRVR
jgi:phosphate transport system substrate-binding protein